MKESMSAREVAARLQPRLTGDGHRADRQPTTNVEAYLAYLRGRFYWNKRTEEGLKKGIEYFNQAIVLDPTYALGCTPSRWPSLKSPPSCSPTRR